MKKIIISLLFIICYSPLSVYGKVEIEKSPTDKREYEYFVLDNKLKVLVVSDKSAEKSAATLTVMAGSYDEPHDKPGLAHFLEHMIIMGSKKYPHPGGFNTYVNDHGGGRNAMTSHDRTTFFYDIQSSYFEESLARFSDHFVHPLFDKNYIEKEIQAVDAEFKMHKEDDFYRGYYVLKNISNPSHNLYRFTAGNKETLWPKDKEGAQELRNQFMAFYDHFYSADKMAVVLVGPQSTKVLAKWAQTYFKDIPLANKKNSVFVLKESNNAFRVGKETQKNIVIHPIKPFYSVSMMFPIPSQKQSYATQPLMYLNMLFANQAPQGLVYLLKQKGWILGMAPNRYEISEKEELFGFNFSLTEAGLSHIDDIIKITFSYIDTIKKSKLPNWIYEEIKKTDQINFQHNENMPASSLANYLAQNIQDYPPEKVISYAYLDSKAVMPKVEIEALLNKLVPENMLLFSWVPGQKQNKMEPFYQVGYHLESFSPQQLQLWKHSGNVLAQPLALPKPNRFLPSDLAIKRIFSYAQPKLIFSDQNQFVWYQPDIEFNMPRVETRIALHTPYIYQSPENMLLARLATGLVGQEMAQYSSELTLAGAGISYDVLETGLGMTISGYSDLPTYEKIVKEGIEAFRQLKVNPDKFFVQKEALLKGYQAILHASPIENFSEEMGVLMLKRKLPTQEMIAHLEKLQPQDLERFQQDFFKHITLELFISGNIKKYEAKNLAQKVMVLINPPSPSTLTTEKQEPAELSPILKLPEKAQLLNLTHQHTDNLVVIYLQMKDKKVNTIAKAYLTEYLIKTKFFDALRTESQFGYIVSSSGFVMRDVAGLIFLVQSPNQEPSLIYKKTSEFLHDYDKTLKQIKPSDFEQVKSSLIADILERPKSLGEKSARSWSEIVDRTYRFDRRAEIAKAVSRISQRELSDFYQEMILGEKRKELTVFGVDASKNKASSLFEMKNLSTIKNKNMFKQNSEYIR